MLTFGIDGLLLGGSPAVHLVARNCHLGVLDLGAHPFFDS